MSYKLTVPRKKVEKKLTLVVLAPTVHRYCAMLDDDRRPYLLILQSLCHDLGQLIEPIDEIPISELLRDAFSIQMGAVDGKNLKVKKI